MRKANGVLVEAVQVGPDNVGEISEWSGAMAVWERDPESDENLGALNVKTPYGIQRASQGMYVVKYSDKKYVTEPEFFVSQQGNFEILYMPVDDVPEKEEDPRASFPREI